MIELLVVALLSAPDYLKDPCIQGQEYNPALWSRINKQQALYTKIKDGGRGDLETAAEVAVYRWIEAWQWNNAAHRIIVSIGEDAPKDLEKVDDYFKTEVVHDQSVYALGLLTKAKLSLDEAKGCATRSKTAKQVAEQIRLCRKAVASNKLYLERVLGRIPWPAK